MRTGAGRAGTLPRAAVLLLAAALLTIGIGEDWRLRHEDNGALHTSLALSHMTLGLSKTRAHNFLYDPATGRTAFYGHHPPGPGLFLAGAFEVTGTTRPWVARGTAIAFQLGSLALFLALAGRLLPPRETLAAGVVFALLPMGAFYGRMPNYEPFALFAVLLQLLGWLDVRLGRRRSGLLLLASGVVLGGLVDWGPFFFAGAIALLEARDLLRKRIASPAALVVAGGSALAVGLFDLWHLWWAGGGTLSPLASILTSSAPAAGSGWDAIDWLEGQVENYRRYFTHAGLLSSMAVLLALLFPRPRALRALLDLPGRDLLVRLLVLSGGASAAYLLAAPSWAMVHQYWQFFFLPFAALSTVLLLRALVAARGAPGRRAPRAPRVVAALLAVELLATSAFVLSVRHGRVERYAVETTAALRASWLAP